MSEDPNKYRDPEMKGASGGETQPGANYRNPKVTTAESGDSGGGMMKWIIIAAVVLVILIVALLLLGII